MPPSHTPDFLCSPSPWMYCLCVQASCTHAWAVLQRILKCMHAGGLVLRSCTIGAYRYGPGSGAFLVSLYGGGELPQAFCRVAAVAGALYVLRAPVQALLLDAAGRICRGVRTAAGQVGFCEQ